ncbi:putative pectate lyase 2 [Primulina tabacum]|uniref:putative pectate lyase 2 n=1 Tax=Primulina tabacum TaxID=48773 RepID=UPI003F5AC2D7
MDTMTVHIFLAIYQCPQCSSCQTSTMAKPRSNFLLFSWLLVFCMLTFRAHSSQKSSKKPSFTSTFKVMNKIDSCWRSNPNWAKNRQSLADCAVGFGCGAMGGKNGAIYVVTDASDDPVNPKAGSLRYGAIQAQPLWIIFERDMTITLKNELMVNSYKTIDGRGAKVEVTGGPCISIDYVSHVIVHGISVHDCKPGKRGMVRSTPDHVGERLGSDGDSISIFASSNIWIDHCYLARATDGLVDIIHGSTGITVSNNYFTQHDKVMLLGHQDGFAADRVMKVTVVFNHFGPGLIQRMPRVRTGYAHVANNRYDQWLMYAIGGSSDPTILSEGNYFVASNDAYAKQVTKRETNNGWKNWKWRSTNDVFINGAYFVPSGYGSCSPNYSGQQYFAAARGSLVPALTSDAGPLQCRLNVKC